MAVGLSGLASGVDTASIVQQLMALERQGQARTSYRQMSTQAKANGLEDIKTKLEALKTAATALRDVGTWSEQQALTSADPARVTATRTGGAPIGTYGITVSQLSAAAQKSYTWTEPATATTLTLDDANGDTPAVTLNIAQGAKLADVATAINAKSDSPVYAAVVNGTKLVLSSRATGAAADFSVTGDALSGVLSSVAGKDAQYVMDGDPTVYSSPTNTVTDAIPGVTLTLKGITTGSVGITAAPPALDQSAIKDKVRAFVTAYNAVVTLARTEVAETKIKDVDSAFEAGVGALYGDTGLISMQSQLRQAMSATFSVGNATTLDDFTDIGISSGKIGSSVEQAKSGLLQIDETKLADAIAKDPQAVQRLMGTVDKPGFSQNVEKLVSGFSDTIKSRVTSITKEAKSIGDQMAAAEERLTAKEKRLTAQFAAMEAALGAAQTQQSWLEGQIKSLPGWGGSDS